ncbi:hypothetical protein SCLCIDRAFT_1217239 [Scleroderma citrinum Foug A]|uniref:Uncharacterized protein n=1 Tax=Scleroderma citrinum Foug A TaxID=1036808 RepID=A0A0C3DUZ4_9AGAM|nr:hypothetical protein SCLCIDRAFT_1217239 [Scleroderma citrinum Foug A]
MSGYVVPLHATCICFFDTFVHIQEEPSNVATAVPWAIIGAIVISSILGVGAPLAMSCLRAPLNNLATRPSTLPLCPSYRIPSKKSDRTTDGGDLR